MLFLIVILVALYAVWYKLLRGRHSAIEISSAVALDPDEVQLLVAYAPPNLKHFTIVGEPGCEYDVFVSGQSIINKPILGGTTSLVRGNKNELIVVAKKNITVERSIVPSVVRFH
jgi:hypothetical protein